MPLSDDQTSLTRLPARAAAGPVLAAGLPPGTGCGRQHASPSPAVGGWGERR